jgi:hypothetical protein
VAELLPEFSVGALSGRERAAVLDHLESCDQCRVEVEQLTLAADSLLQAGPRIEPPLGFEQRLVERMVGSDIGSATTGTGTGTTATGTTATRTPPRRRWRHILAVAASLAVLGLGVGLGFAMSPGGSPAPTQSPEVASLSEGGQVYGHVVTYPAHGGQPAWLSMKLRDAEWNGWVRCQITVSNGKTITIGRFWLHGGTGHWGSELPVSPNQVTAASVIGGNNKTVASAVFTS